MHSADEAQRKLDYIDGQLGSERAHGDKMDGLKWVRDDVLRQHPYLHRPVPKPPAKPKAPVNGGYDPFDALFTGNTTP